MSTMKQWKLIKRPGKGVVTTENVKLEEVPIPTPGENEVLVKVTLCSVDPTQRIWMTDAPQYMPCIELGDPIRALVVGEVTESSSEKLPIGTLVSGLASVSEYVTMPVETTPVLDKSIPHEIYLSAMALHIGLTAYKGCQIMEVKEGKTIVVSGAAGAVGSLAGQIAKIQGATNVIGIVGTDEKANWITKELGFDHAINYKTDNVDEKLSELAPNGIDGYFENVGGPITHEVLLRCNNFARVAFCGAISAYNEGGHATLSCYDMILMRRITIQGFICLDHIAEMPEVIAFMSQHVKEGRIKHKADVREGIDNFVDIFNLLFSGGNTGKLMIRF